MRTNPRTGIYSGYYRLVESYRNENGRVCHRTMLNAGYLDQLNTDQLNLIQRIITAKASNCNDSLFTVPYTSDKVVNQYVDEFYQRLIDEKRIDIDSEKSKNKKSNNIKDIQKIDVNSIKNKDVREIGDE